MAQVYAICFPNDKLYVGMTTKTVAQRFQDHVRGAKEGSTCTVHNALRKYGPDSVRLVTLHSGVTDDEAKELEMFHIAEWDLRNPDNGYNMTAGGDGAVGLGPESLAKMSKAIRCWWADPETRQKISETLRGKPKSPETRQKMSEAHRGKTRSPETRQKISETLRGKPKSPETRQKMSEAMRRYWADPEHRQKMSEAMRRCDGKALG